jgi:hypothetical protein
MADSPASSSETGVEDPLGEGLDRSLEDPLRIDQANALTLTLENCARISAQRCSDTSDASRNDCEPPFS